MRMDVLYCVHAERVCHVPPFAFELPCGFDGEGGKYEPVNVLVLLEVDEADEEEAGEKSSALVDGDALVDLVGERVEGRGPISVLEVLDRDELPERSRDGPGNGVVGYSG